MRAHCLLLVALSLLGACSSDDHPSAFGAQRLPECPNVDHEPCDTRASQCQARLLALATCIYGVAEAPNVPIRVVTEEQLLAELEAGGSSNEEDDAQAARSLPHVDRALSDLLLLQAGSLTQGSRLQDLIDRIDGVYQDAERGIALVDRGMPKRSAEIDAVLVHELVHAIQDARYDLSSWRQQFPADVDTQLALRSATEGPATYAQFRAVYAMSGADLRRSDLSAQLTKFRSSLLANALADPSPYFASLATFPYAIGVGVAARAWSDTGQHLSEAQLDAPPLTTRDALAESFELDLPPLAAGELASPEPTSDYELVDETSLGAFMLELHAHKAGLSEEQSRQLALSWQADRLWIYEGPEQRTAWLWELQLDGASLNGASSLPAGVVRQQLGDRAFLAGGEEPPEFLLAAGRAFLNDEAP